MKFQQSRVPIVNMPSLGIKVGGGLGGWEDVLTGSRPVVTSSRMTSFGSPIVERTILNLLLMPPLKAPTLPSFRCHSLTLLSRSSPVISASSFPTPLILAYNRIYR